MKKLDGDSTSQGSQQGAEQNGAVRQRPQDIAQKIKAGRGWLVVRNSATLAETDYERVAEEIVDALNKRHAYQKLVGDETETVVFLRGMASAAEANAMPETAKNLRTVADQKLALLRELGEAQ